MNRIFILFVLLSFKFCMSQTYYFPEESEQHEGTWLQWPHQYQFGTTYRNRLDATWVAMANALQTNEKVHIIAYDNTEKARITGLLNAAGVPLTNVDFRVYPTDDVWVRDNGPIFAKNSSNQLVIEDWGFNGWGGKYNSSNCNQIPTKIGTDLGMTVANLNSVMVNEGGSVELDGGGVLMACKSSVISQSPANTVRNPGMTEAQATSNFMQYYGVSKVIWLNGVTGLEVTDMHIDGFMRFANPNTIVTMSNSDLLNWGLTQTDINILYSTTNVAGQVYTKVYVPQTQNNVVTTYGTTLSYKGSYANYYVANGVVLVPNYNDPNDAVANQIIGNLYPGRTVIGIDVRNLYANGGMVHCVTQQQPAVNNTLNTQNTGSEKVKIAPNPTSGEIKIHSEKKIKNINVYNSLGQKLELKNSENKLIDIQHLPKSVYVMKIVFDDNTEIIEKIIKK